MYRLKYTVLIALMIVTGCSNVEGENSIETTKENNKIVELENNKENIVDIHTEINEGNKTKEELSPSSKHEVYIDKMAGEGNTLFSYSSNMPLRVTIKNNGVNTLNFKIKHPNKQTLAEDTLNPNETYVNTFNPSDLEEGKYMISFLQDSGADMSAYVKVEPIEKI